MELMEPIEPMKRLMILLAFFLACLWKWYHNAAFSQGLSFYLFFPLLLLHHPFPAPCPI
jgi:hypothetical protein